MFNRLRHKLIILTLSLLVVPMFFSAGDLVVYVSSVHHHELERTSDMSCPSEPTSAHSPNSYYPMSTEECCPRVHVHYLRPNAFFRNLESHHQFTDIQKVDLSPAKALVGPYHFEFGAR